MSCRVETTRRSGWKRRVRSSVLHILAVSHYTVTALLAKAALSKNRQVRLQAQIDRRNPDYWSVSVRRGEEVSEWSRYDYWDRFTCVHPTYKEFAFFAFRILSK